MKTERTKIIEGCGKKDEETEGRTKKARLLVCLDVTLSCEKDEIDVTWFLTIDAEQIIMLQD